jgi:hypothetical protein
MSTITDLLRDTVKVINELTENSEEAIQRNLGMVIALNHNAKALTLERYMAFMNEHIFTKLSKESPLEDLRQLVPLIEKLAVLVSDDGLSLEQALVTAQNIQAVVAVALKKPTSFACVLSTGKQILPAVRRLFATLKCNGVSSVPVVAAVDAAVEVAHVAVAAVEAAPAVDAPPAVEEPQPKEQPQPESESALAPPSHELHAVEPTQPASDNTDQKEEPAN